MSTRSLRMVGNALYFFDGKVYRFVDWPTMNRLIMDSCRKYVYAVGYASIIRRIYEVIQAEPNISVSRADDTVPLVALDDGLLDLTTFSLHPFSPVPFVTVKLNGNYTMGNISDCPIFNNFLTHITGNNPTLIERIWQSIGYCLVPDIKAKAFILLQGVPDSGKSLLGDVVASLIDQDLVTSLDISALSERFGPSELVGKQLCLALDMPSGALDAKAVSMFKSLTGGDFVTADVKYQNRIKFKCSASFLLATNHALLTRDQDTAFLRRAVTIPFQYTVEKPQQDYTLKAQILSEKNAIIYRAIQAYSRLRANNYQFSGNFEPNDVVFNQGTSVTNFTDILWDFCRESCIPTADSFVPTNTIYQAFSAYSGCQWPGGIKSFSDSIFQVFSTLSPGKITRDRKRPKGTSENPERGFSGLALKIPCR